MTTNRLAVQPKPNPYANESIYARAARYNETCVRDDIEWVVRGTELKLQWR